MFKQGETVEYLTKHSGWHLAEVLSADCNQAKLLPFGGVTPQWYPLESIRRACLARNGRCDFARCDAPPRIKMPRDLSNC